MLIERACKGARGTVFVNGAKVSDVVAVYALWDGGPGIIELLYRDGSGHLVLGNNEVAKTLRVVRSVSFRRDAAR